MNIEVGEYIRTKQGDISKVRYVDEESIFLEDSVWSKNDLYEKTGVLYFDDEEIVKHSKNIIDLIEVGDYVNGARAVSEKYHYNNINFIDVDNKISYGWGEGAIMESEIESIVTKQQFSNMEYRV